MSIVVTGATGQLGRLVVAELLARGVAAHNITAAGRDIDKIKDLAERGVTTRTIDFGDPATLRAAFIGAEKVLLISGSEIGRRAQQHQNAIDAASDAGVALLAYTSIANADTQTIQLAVEHQATERALRASSVASTVLRHGWYLENYTGQVSTYLEHGVVLGSGKDGRISAAARADFAAAAAVVLTTEGHDGAVYELGGDEAFTLDDLAQTLSEVAGQPVVYNDLPVEEYTQTLVSVGLPEPVAAVLADSDLGVAAGELYVDSGDLRRLIGRPTTTLREAISAAIEGTA